MRAKVCRPCLICKESKEKDGRLQCLNCLNSSLRKAILSHLLCSPTWKLAGRACVASISPPLETHNDTTHHGSHVPPSTTSLLDAPCCIGSKSTGREAYASCLRDGQGKNVEEKSPKAAGLQLNAQNFGLPGMPKAVLSPKSTLTYVSSSDSDEAEDAEATDADSGRAESAKMAESAERVHSQAAGEAALAAWRFSESAKRAGGAGGGAQWDGARGGLGSGFGSGSGSGSPQTRLGSDKRRQCECKGAMQKVQTKGSSSSRTLEHKLPRLMSKSKSKFGHEVSPRVKSPSAFVQLHVGVGEDYVQNEDECQPSDQEAHAAWLTPSGWLRSKLLPHGAPGEPPRPGLLFGANGAVARMGGLYDAICSLAAAVQAVRSEPSTPRDPPHPSSAGDLNAGVTAGTAAGTSAASSRAKMGHGSANNVALAGGGGGGSGAPPARIASGGEYDTGDVVPGCGIGPGSVSGPGTHPGAGSISDSASGFGSGSGSISGSGSGYCSEVDSSGDSSSRSGSGSGGAPGEGEGEEEGEEEEDGRSNAGEQHQHQHQQQQQEEEGCKVAKHIQAEMEEEEEVLQRIRQRCEVALQGAHVPPGAHNAGHQQEPRQQQQQQQEQLQLEHAPGAGSGCCLQSSCSPSSSLSGGAHSSPFSKKACSGAGAGACAEPPGPLDCEDQRHWRHRDATAELLEFLMGGLSLSRPVPDLAPSQSCGGSCCAGFSGSARCFGNERPPSKGEGQAPSGPCGASPALTPGAGSGGQALASARGVPLWRRRSVAPPVTLDVSPSRA